jgi:hypothetical protein
MDQLKSGSLFLRHFYPIHGFDCNRKVATATRRIAEKRRSRKKIVDFRQGHGEVPNGYGSTVREISGFEL